MVARVRSGLVTARQRQGHTRESLAHALGVESSTVGRWERGTTDPLPLMWPRLAHELDITTDDLVGFLAKPCCQTCGKVLAADNTTNLCGGCRRDQHGHLDTPPQLGPEFFDTPEFWAAFESQHFGRVLKAYRTHPHFVRMLTKPLTQENLGRWLGLNQNQISRLENDKPEQNLKTLQKWVEILHLPPQILWFDMPGQSRWRSPFQAGTIESGEPGRGRQDIELVTVESVNRKDFLKATLGVGAGALLTQTELGFDNPDSAEVLSGPTAHYRRMESAVPSDQLAPAVEAHLRLASHLVQQRMSTAFGYQVMSEIAGLAAWLAADRGDTATARRRYADAIKCAERAHHPLLVSYMTASLGHFAVEMGNPRAGLKMIRRASVLLDHAAPNAARAWIESLCATAHAALGDSGQAIGSLRLAETLVDREGPELRWPWVFKFDSAKVARYQAGAFGRMGNIRSATAAYESAAPAMTTPKPRALAQIEHSHVLAQSGDIGGGCALAVAALYTARTYGSERITTRVREFRASLPVQTAEAATLDDALSALYEPSSQ